jgi:ribosome maturation factor RimP
MPRRPDVSATSQADGVRALIEPLAEKAGLVLEGVTITPAGRRRVLRVVVDLPEDETGGVPLDMVAEVSQSVSAALDAGNVMGGTPYVLEVSSPGVDRPLTERRHWGRARTRLVKVRLTEGHAEGRLTAVDDEGIELDGERRLPWSDVAGGRVEVEFAHPGEAEGADGGEEVAE